MSFDEATILEARRRANSRCVRCNQPCVEVAHIVPEVEGGEDTLENAVTLCTSCHSKRRSYDPVLWKHEVRQWRDHWWKRCAAAASIHPLGLALSGGGFRATAFHLGVLKRLRELKLLHEIDLISTVSGGSIAGAYWVYWQATKGDTLASPEEWDKFESSLITFMRQGVRRRVLWWGFWVPAIILAAMAVSILSVLPSPPFYLWAVLLAGVFSAAYVVWHYRASSLLSMEYRRRLFGDTTLSALSYPPTDTPANTKWPRLLINCTVLNTGHVAVFTNDHPIAGPELWTTKLGMFPNIYESIRVQELARTMAPVPMPSDTALATAVATSSCFPGAFAPLSLKAPKYAVHELGGHWYYRARKDYPLRLVDGGVVDNQGTYTLLGAKCRALISSDASAALRIQPNPSTWQIFPPGRGVIFRVLDVIYHQVRNMGGRRLADIHSLSLLAKDAALNPEASANLQTRHLWVKGYCHIDLDSEGSELFEQKFDSAGYAPLPCLSTFLTYFASRIRTDLDKFSPIEISTLMFHGYSLTEHVLFNRDRADWAPLDAEPFRFHTSEADINLDWATLSPRHQCYGDSEEFLRQVEISRHLQASDSRIGVWRNFRRLCNRWRRGASFELEVMGLRGQPHPVAQRR